MAYQFLLLSQFFHCSLI